MKIRNQSLSLLTISVIAGLAAFNANANTELAQSDVRNASAAAEDLSYLAKKAFYEDSSAKLHSFLYIRDREQKNAEGDYKPQIENQTLQLALDYRSGYFKDVIGFDLWASTNLKLGDTVGQSEILLYDYDCNDDGVTDDPCEKTNTSLNVAAVKAKFGNEDMGLAVRGGYTRINIGTIRSSWGLNPHAYRGAEAKASFGKFIVGYAWADQFKNDWSSKFKDLTNKWHQGEEGMSAAENIDFIHTVGAIYKLDNGVIDLGYGEGKEYRKNWQALVKYNFDLGSDLKLNTAAFYHGGKYIEGDVSQVQDASNESYIGLGADLKHGGFSWRLAYSQTDAPDTKAYNFRLTPWANSDNRKFLQAKAQLDDYAADGTNAVKFGVDYNFADWGIPELSAGVSANYGWNVVTDVKAKADARTYDGTMKSLDYNIRYKFMDGGLEGLNVKFYPAYFRSEDTNYKADRNDMKLLFSYTYTAK
ncbi:OprD family outer membrane porin [Photobacterium sp.]|uniref:OprD family outer membrane porin n=1 Tax=Photobacterium sp. TaxID=660 RepID=UPI00299DA010|nr:OprD family outer membrane porin [Photobacterium sp.]MDX1301339.1 OprD family outer membrane porin [Photobacterium sp.]